MKMLKYLRKIWIETLLASGTRNWFTNKIISEKTRQEFVSKKILNTNLCSDIVELEDNRHFRELYYYMMGNRDFVGNKIYAIDRENELAIVSIKGKHYSGKIILAFNPNNVQVAFTDKQGKRGNNILEFMKNNNAVAAVNASGFKIVDKNNCLGNILGLAKNSSGFWGELESNMDSIIIDNRNQLRVGNIDLWLQNDVRDGVQFFPSLIINGESQIKGTGGWGIQPRTAIGQRKDGTILLMVIDGRNIFHSMGATLEDVINEFKKYNVINAAALDGGGSAIMGYRGNIINKSCSGSKLGRLVPTAFIIKRPRGIHNK